MTKKTKIILSIIGLLVIAGGIYWYSQRPQGGNETPIDTNTNTVTDSTTSPIQVGLINGQTGTVDVKNADGSITKVPALSKEVIDKIPKPNLDRAIIITATNVDSKTKTLMENRIKDAISAVKASPYSFDNWIRLGAHYKIAGDYNSAKEMWEYVNLANPTNVASFSNLGDLYQFYLKDNVKAEYNLKKVVSNDPNYLAGYINLFNLYNLSYQTSTNKAEEVLKQGIATNPKAIDLMTTLASYYESKKDFASAKIQYEKALVLAKELKNNQIIDTLNSTIQNLPK